MRAVFAGDIDGVVRASGINHVQVIAPAKRSQTFGQISFFILG